MLRELTSERFENDSASSTLPGGYSADQLLWTANTTHEFRPERQTGGITVGQGFIYEQGPLVSLSIDSGSIAFADASPLGSSNVVTLSPGVAAALKPETLARFVVDASATEFQLRNPSELDRLQATLQSYLKLEEGWDGYNGLPASPEAVEDALEFLQQKPADIRLPYPQLSSDGEVGLYWQTDKVFADVGFRGKRLYSVYATYRGEPAAEFASDGLRLAEDAWPPQLIQILERA